jgi:FixJ family two-component response regulator
MSDDAPLVQVIEDDGSVRQAVTRLLRAAGFEVAAYPSAGEFMLLGNLDRPGCIVLDVGLPGMNGIEFHAALSKEHDPSIVFVTGRGDIAMGVRAMKQGAVDFLCKPIRREELLRAVTRALARDANMRARRARLAELDARYHALSARERQVFEMVVEGKLNKQVADTIGASIRTVKSHRAKVMDKMHAKSMVDLVRAADELKSRRRVAGAD